VNVRSRQRILAGFLCACAVAAAAAGCTSDSHSTAHPIALPSDFPTSIPLASRDVKSSDTSGRAWITTVNVDDPDAQQAALKKLTDKGFTVIGSSGAKPSDSVYSLADASYSIRLGFGAKGGAYTVTYSVAPRSN
jgi:hypothetical protein